MAAWGVLIMIFAALAGVGNFLILIDGNPAAGTNVLLAAILFALGLLLWFQDVIRDHILNISDKLGPTKERAPAEKRKQAAGNVTPS